MKTNNYGSAIRTVNLYGNNDGIAIYLDSQGLLCFEHDLDSIFRKEGTLQNVVKIIGLRLQEYSCSVWEAYQSIRKAYLSRCAEEVCS